MTQPAWLDTQRLAELAVVAACALWGASFVVTKHALRSCSPIAFVALRYAVASAALAVLYGRRLRRCHAPAAMGCGALLFAGFALQTVGLRSIGASRSAFLTALCIPLTPMCGSLLHWRRPVAHELLGCALALAGIACITADGLQAGAMLRGGDVLTLACAVVYSVHNNALAHVMPDSGGGASAFETIAFGQVATATALAAVLSPMLETPFIHPSAALLADVLLTGLLATTVAFTLYVWALRTCSASRAALLCSTEALFAAMAAYAAYGETLTPLGCVGAALVAAAVGAGGLRGREEPSQKPGQPGCQGVTVELTCADTDPLLSER